jgi:hypothetical protein
MDTAELTIGRQLQRVRGELLDRETKTQASDATLPLPSICLTALKQRQASARRCSSTWTYTRIVMQIFRHAQFHVTMEVYASASSATTQKALKRLGASLDG